MGLARAIALCFPASEDHPRPVVIVKTCAHFSSSDTVFGIFGTAQQVQRHTPDQGKIAGRVVFSAAIGIFTELHVQHPVLAVLNGPMAADYLGEALQVID